MNPSNFFIYYVAPPYISLEVYCWSHFNSAVVICQTKRLVLVSVPISACGTFRRSSPLWMVVVYLTLAHSDFDLNSARAPKIPPLNLAEWLPSELKPKDTRTEAQRRTRAFLTHTLAVINTLSVFVCNHDKVKKTSQQEALGTRRCRKSSQHIV